jgi:transposase-like protein
MTVYSDRFKETMVRKMTGAYAQSATSLAAETGVPQTTLSRWLLRYGRVDSGSTPMNAKKRPNKWPAENKLEALQEYDGCTDEEARGRFLRENGLHSADIERWRQEIVEALKQQAKRSDPRDRRIKELEKELNRKNKALAETAALLALKKNALRIWGDDEDEK